MLQLFTLLLVLILVKTLLPKIPATASYIVSFVLAILFVIQLSSVVLTGEIANYRFYENFNLKDVLSVSEFFGKEGVLLFLSIIGATLLIEFSSLFLKNKLFKKTISLVLLLSGIVILSTSGGIINNAYSTVRLKFSSQVSLTDALSAIGINTKEYIKPEDIKASVGKNIIVLSLESFEKGYLSDKLKHLTPNLRRLGSMYNLYSMNQTPAGGWTSASMYTSLTGVPAFFKRHGNSVFQGSYENKITNLPSVLNSAGYDLQYFIGKKEYSGIDAMLTSMNFTVKSEKDFTTTYSKVPWGMQDKDLFEEFKKELLIQQKSKNPFAMFLSTISTHFPNGVPDKRIDSLFPPQRSRLELMVSATDHFVGDLIQFLDDENFLSNTVFYIYPDHLLMGDKSVVVEDFDQRSLFFLTNAELSNKLNLEKKGLFQIDLPKLILQGAEVNNNAKFLTDYITEEDKISFLNTNKKQLLQLNEAALKTRNCSEGIFIELDQEQEMITIKNKDNLKLLTKPIPIPGSCHRIVFDDQWRMLRNFAITPIEVVNPPKTTNYYLDIFKSNGVLYSSLKDSYNFGITKQAIKEIIFDESDFSLFDGIGLLEDQKNSITLMSNSWHAKASSSYIINGVSHALPRGLTVIIFNTVSPQQFEEKTFDTYGSAEDASSFVNLAESLQKSHIPYIIIAHDAATKRLLPHKGQLKKLGFEKLSSLPGRHAYIGYQLNGKSKELSDKSSITQLLNFPKNIKNTTRYLEDTNKPIPFVSSNERFIAHAGGELNKTKYTNAKEALDNSYQLGFRLFELDIEKTKDGAFVATHDWKHWAKQTGYTGDLPVTREEFLKHKIYGKYTPLDMKGINRWFKEHPQAILITDKVNEPVAFANGFVDQKRLMMELFTIDAVEEASENNIITLVSGKPLSQIKGDPITYFKKNNLKHVAISRRNILAKKDLLKKFRENNIKVYVYHVNFDPEKNEQYVLKNEIGIVYGMYADKWIADFNQKKLN